MASLFDIIAPKIIPKDRRSHVPAGVWVQCPKCKESLYSKDLEENGKVCPGCEFHFRLSVEERIEQLVDTDTFRELFGNLKSKDPLKFVDSKKYKDRIKATVNRTGMNEAIVTGDGMMNGMRVTLAVFNFRFMGGSMGAVVGEKITRAIEHSIEQQIPLIIVSASGGARMQEGTLSLMQMAKTSAALQKLAEARIPFVSLLTDPTTGGVSASFAMLGDVNIAEKGALIGFAGPRVIQETIGEDLPEGFQRAEFLLKHGAIDMEVHRSELKATIFNLLSMLYRPPKRLALEHQSP